LKPRIYLESSFISVLTARPSHNMVKQARQLLSQELWDLRLEAYDAFCSLAVVAEIVRGDPEAAALRRAKCQGLPMLAITPLAESLAENLIASGAIPPTEPEDALHIAVAAAGGMDYIASWNFAHLIGTVLKLKLQKRLGELGYEKLVIANPEEIVESVLDLSTNNDSKKD
jgi:predicted nucleic acid-binding protein